MAITIQWLAGIVLVGSAVVSSATGFSLPWSRVLTSDLRGNGSASLHKSSPAFMSKCAEKGNAPLDLHEKEEKYEREWDALMKFCTGNWSGSIGWFDAEGMGILKPRPDNRKRNMRLSFHPSDESPDVANWIVYHARAQGLREEVVLQKYPAGDDDGLASPLQTFYEFEDGIIGRTGTNFTALPVIEHGFWDNKDNKGMRRTVVLVYNKTDLQKICFLQQERKHLADGEEFDVSATELEDIPVLPENHELTLDEVRTIWNDAVIENVEQLSGGIRRRHDPSSADDSLARLLGTDHEAERNRQGQEDILRVVLPNGVILACPWSIGGRKNFWISMGYMRQCGQLQVVEFAFEDAVLTHIRATWSKISRQHQKCL